ncbi:hypothetical protein REH81_03380 [Vibrio rotiferianus]
MKFPLGLFTLACVLCQCFINIAHANQVPFTQELNASMLNRTSFVLEPVAKHNTAKSGDGVFESKLAYKMDERQSLHQAIETANALSDTLLDNAFPLGYNAKTRTAHTEVKNDSEVYVVVQTQITEKTLKSDGLDEIAKSRYLALVNNSLSYQEVLTANLANNYTF